MNTLAPGFLVPPLDKLRMAKMEWSAEAEAAAALLDQIRDRYRALRRLPGVERSSDSHRRPSPAYLALEAEIRGLADQYRRICP